MKLKGIFSLILGFFLCLSVSVDAQKLGNWSYNGAPIVSAQRPEGKVIITMDGNPASTVVVKGRDWLKNVGVAPDSVLYKYVPDSKLPDGNPTASELNYYNSFRNIPPSNPVPSNIVAYKIGNWSYNSAQIIAVERSGGKVIITMDGNPASVIAVKGRSWLRNVGLVDESALSGFIDDSSLPNGMPSESEVNIYRSLLNGNSDPVTPAPEKPKKVKKKKAKA